MKKTTQRCVSLLIFIIVPGLCLAEDLPGNQKKTGTLTVQEAAELVKKGNEQKGHRLNLDWLTSIDRDVARELSYFGGNILCLDGLISIDEDVAHQLTKVRPGRFGWTSKPDSKTPYKSISLNGLISITKDVAQGLAKCDGSLELNSVKSMDSEMVREFTKFKGFFLYIRGLESIAPEDYTLLKQSLKHPAPGKSYRVVLPGMADEFMRNGAQSMPPEDYTLLRQATKSPGLANWYRAMLPGLLRFEKGWRKWHGKRIEFRKDGSKAKQTDYKNGSVTLRMEWDEAGNLTKKETFPVKKTVGVYEQDIETNKVMNLKPEYPEVDLTFNKELITYGQEYYPLIDLEYDKLGIASVVGEDEPFTGIAVVYRSNDPNSERVWEYAFLNGRKHGNSVQYSAGDFIQRIEEFNEGELIRSFYQSDQDLLETRYKNGKPAMKLTWGKDGNLIEKETF